MVLRSGIAALVVLATLATATSASPRRASVRWCAPKDLGIHHVLTQGAAGSEISDFEFINVSRHTCRLRGYPGVAAYDRAGRKLPIHVRREPVASGEHTVRLAPHHRVRFEISSLQDPPNCWVARHLRFTPPDDFSTLQIAVRIPICHRGHFMWVHPVGYPRF